MKHIIFLLSLIAASAAVFAQSPDAMEEAAPLADTVSFDKVLHDFGAMQKGKGQEVVFNFTNTTSTPLVIVDAEVNCKCTKVKYDKRPVMPGGKGTITVSYDAKQTGTFYKRITLRNNIYPQGLVLTIKGEVR